jgi:RNA recognition motif-containing protein
MRCIQWKQTPPNGVEDNHRMSFTVFLGNLPTWVTADDIKGWLSAENLVADAIKVIRNPETQESKGFAFIEAPNSEEMNAIIRRFDRAPLEDRLLRANPAQPPKPKGQGRVVGGPGAGAGAGAGPAGGQGPDQRPPRRHNRKSGGKRTGGGPQSAFAEELAKVL